MQVPDIEHPHVFQPPDVPAIPFDALTDGIGPLPFARPIFAGGNVDARHQALQVPFPGTDRSFVEVIQIEDHVALRSPVEPEVVNVSIAVDDDPYTAIGSL